MHEVPARRELIPREGQVKQRSLGWEQRLSHQRQEKIHLSVYYSNGSGLSSMKSCLTFMVEGRGRVWAKDCFPNSPVGHWSISSPALGSVRTIVELKQQEGIYVNEAQVWYPEDSSTPIKDRVSRKGLSRICLYSYLNSLFRSFMHSTNTEGYSDYAD